MRLSHLPQWVLDKIEPEPYSGCWLWTGNWVGNRYGQISIGGGKSQKRYPAHRYIFGLLKGPIPAGYQLDHLCRTRACVNPAHLKPMTSKHSPIHLLKTHCPQGHPYAGDNLYLRPDGRGRDCKICRRIAVGRSRQNIIKFANLLVDNREG